MNYDLWIGVTGGVVVGAAVTSAIWIARRDHAEHVAHRAVLAKSRDARNAELFAMVDDPSSHAVAEKTSPAGTVTAGVVGDGVAGEITGSPACADFEAHAGFATALVSTASVSLEQLQRLRDFFDDASPVPPSAVPTRTSVESAGDGAAPEESGPPPVTDARALPLYNVHRPEFCAGHPCTIHAPSDHEMRKWPVRWALNAKLIERSCPHGLWLIDPDEVAFQHHSTGIPTVQKITVCGCRYTALGHHASPSDGLSAAARGMEEAGADLSTAPAQPLDCCDANHVLRFGGRKSWIERPYGCTCLPDEKEACES